MTAPRFLLLADGDFGPMTSKTANAIVRYRAEQVVGVLDRGRAGSRVEDVLGFGGAIPVVGDIETGLALGPTVLLIGIAPMGGRLPDEWRAWIARALERGLEVWNGLHTFLGEDPVLANAAERGGGVIRDLRRPPPSLPIASGLAAEVEPFVVLTVGTDCNVGKMTAQLQLVDQLRAHGLRTRFVATGQTGIMLEGWGIAVDAVIADFIAGAAEWLVLEAAREADVVLVEGQGSINHPGYSGVTLGLLHGSCPDALILCHDAGRRAIGDYRQADRHPIPPLDDYVRWYETMGSAVHPTRVIGIAMNTWSLDDRAAAAAVEDAARVTGLPAADPVRFGATPLVEAILAERERYVRMRVA